MSAGGAAGASGAAAAAAAIAQWHAAGAGQEDLDSGVVRNFPAKLKLTPAQIDDVFAGRIPPWGTHIDLARLK